MTRPIIRIHDLETDKVIDREMTDAEFEQYETDLTAAEIAKNELVAKENAKAQLLDRLGITEDEAKLLLA